MELQSSSRYLAAMTAEMDPRWAILVNFDPATSQWVPMSLKELERSAEVWSALVPEYLNAKGPVSLLRMSRSLFIHSWSDYDFMVIACLVSLQALEAGFRERYDKISCSKPLEYFIKHAAKVGELSPRDVETLDAGREIRNDLAHPKMQSSITLGMATPIISISHRLVVQLLATERPAD